MIEAKKYPGIRAYIEDKTVPSFITKKEAQEHAKKLHWSASAVIRIMTPFQKVWIVAQIYGDTSLMIVPLYYEKISGIEQMRTLKFNRE